MKTRVVPIDAARPDPDLLADAARVLQAGGLVAFPTETVYGLGAHALDARAVAGIFRAKGRPANNPLIVHVAEVAAARELVVAWPERAARLAEHFWPGPLTLVLPKRPQVPDVTTAGGSTVALRVPAHPVACGLIAAAGIPLAAPSANASTHISATTAEHVLRNLDGRVDMLLDGGPTSGGLESTVVDLSRGTVRLLRPGLLGVAALEAVLGEPIAHATIAADESAALPAPGMLSRHYAPTVPLELVASGGLERVRELTAGGARVGWLALESTGDATVGGAVVRLLPREVAAYSAGLYAALHAFELAGVERIVVDMPPDAPAWLAVQDRLRRAAEPPPA